MARRLLSAPGPVARLLALLALVLPVAAGAVLAPAEAPTPHREEETLLVDALQHLRGSRLDDALRSIETLVRKHPNFRLAQLVYGDLLLAKAGSLSTFGSLPNVPTEDLDGLRQEARSRLHHHLAHPPGERVPASLLRLSPSQRQALVVDVERSRLYLFENRDGAPRLTADFYASMGKNGAVKQRQGDRRTPVGVYFVTGRIEASALPDFYGAGAFPLSYPNEWDRRLGKTGYGIWLHGVPSDTYSRPPRASDGCVTLANDDLQAIASRVRPGSTPVVIGRQVRWVEPAALERRGAALAQALEQWRRDWESMDPARYAAHYAGDFRAGDKDRAAWMRHKRRVNARKSHIRVRISDVSLLAYPDEADLVVVSFDQDYSSSNYESRSRKRQYWRRGTDGLWRIIYEGPA